MRVINQFDARKEKLKAGIFKNQCHDARPPNKYITVDHCYLFTVVDYFSRNQLTLLSKGQGARGVYAGILQEESLRTIGIISIINFKKTIYICIAGCCERSAYKYLKYIFI